MIQQQEVNDRKLSIIRETTEKDDQIKSFVEEIDKLNQILTKERIEKDNKVRCLLFSFEFSSHSQESFTKDVFIQRIDLSESIFIDNKIKLCLCCGNRCLIGCEYSRFRIIEYHIRIILR